MRSPGIGSVYNMTGCDLAPVGGNLKFGCIALILDGRYIQSSSVCVQGEGGLAVQKHLQTVCNKSIPPDRRSKLWSGRNDTHGILEQGNLY